MLKYSCDLVAREGDEDGGGNEEGFAEMVSHIISTTFFFEVCPLMMRMRDWGMSKCSARAMMIALFAFPCRGRAETSTMSPKSGSLVTLVAFLPVLTVRESFNVPFLSRYHLIGEALRDKVKRYYKETQDDGNCGIKKRRERCERVDDGAHDGAAKLEMSGGGRDSFGQ